jgi:hypothetical protein
MILTFQLVYLISCHSNHEPSGFAAEAPVKCLDTLSAQSSEYNPTIEEDQIVSANGN